MRKSAHSALLCGKASVVFAGIVSDVGVCLGRRGLFAFLLRFHVLLRGSDVFVPAAFLIGERHGVAILVGRTTLNSAFGIGSFVGF